MCLLGLPMQLHLPAHLIHETGALAMKNKARKTLDFELVLTELHGHQHLVHEGHSLLFVFD